MPKPSIEDTILKLTNRYVVRKQITEVKRGYRIGIGKYIEVILNSNTQNHLLKEIKAECNGYTIIFRHSNPQ